MCIRDENGDDTGKKIRRIYKELVPRYAFAFQQIITIKQLVHLCGNDIQFELGAACPTDEEPVSYTHLPRRYSSTVRWVSVWDVSLIMPYPLMVR